VNDAKELRMTISPPLAVSAILALILAAIAWLAPPPARDLRVMVELPAEVYDNLARQVAGQTDALGRPISVSQAITDLASRSATDFSGRVRLVSPLSR
jgi:hypothetical protein